MRRTEVYLKSNAFGVITERVKFHELIIESELWRTVDEHEFVPFTPRSRRA